MIIYLTTNLISGKQYVGQTNTNNKYYLGSGSILQNAIKKYGRKNFKRETLIECSSQEELDKQESFWIQALNTLQPNGYNIELGGNGTGKLSEQQIEKLKNALTGKSFSEEHKKKLKDNHVGMLGKTHTIEARKKIGEGALGRKGFKDKKHTEETRKKISKAHIGKKHTEEHRRKNSEAKKEYWREKKGVKK